MRCRFRCAVLLGVIAAACTGDDPFRPSERSIVGVYLATEYRVVVSDDDVDVIDEGATMRLELRDDGTAVVELLMEGEYRSIDAEWVLDGDQLDIVSTQALYFGFDELAFTVPRRGVIEGRALNDWMSVHAIFEERPDALPLRLSLPAELVILSVPETDTIESLLDAPVRIQVFDSTGAPARSRTVLLQASDISSPRGGMHSSVLVGGSVGELGGWSWVITDSAGEASIYVQLAHTAGRASFRMTAGTVSDSVVFQIEPGAADSIVPVPVDTAVAVGSSYEQSARVLDRRGNVRADPLTVSAHSEHVAASGTVVEGLAYGRGWVTIASGDLSAQVGVSVVPAGRLVGVRMSGGGYQEIVGFDVDGSDVQVILDVQTIGATLAPAPSPVDDRVVYEYNFLTVGGGTYDDWRRLMVVTPGGVPMPFIADSLPDAFGPAWSRDGSELFFSTFHYPGQVIWTADAAGIDADTVPIPVQLAGAPSPSPDASRIAFMEFVHLGPHSLRVYDRTSATVSSWGVAGHTPRWSPVDDRVAYIADDGALMLLDPESGVSTTVSADYIYSSENLTWSPDGEWLIAHAEVAFWTGVLHLIRVDDGLLIPLSYSNQLSQVTWDAE
ncbi:MAG TPA: hypothetical protein VF039_06020 [Longimicrobiales bacterium]